MLNKNKWNTLSKKVLVERGGGNKLSLSLIGIEKTSQTKSRLLSKSFALVFIIASFVLSLATQCSGSGSSSSSGGGSETPIDIGPNDLVLNVSSIEMAASPESYTFTINTDLNWQITGIPDWLSVSPTRGIAGTASLVTITTATVNTVRGLNATLTIHASLNASSPVVTRSLRLNRSNFDICGGTYGLPGPSVMLLKYLDNTNPSPSALSATNADMALIAVRGCGDTTTTVQSVFSGLRYINVINNSGNTVSSLSLITHPWDSNIFNLKGNAGATIIYKIIPESSPGISNGNTADFSYSYHIVTGLPNGFPASNCISFDCFARISNVAFEPTMSTNTAFGDITFSRLLSSELNSASGYDPTVRQAINDMYTKYAERTDVTWRTSTAWRSVLIP